VNCQHCGSASRSDWGYECGSSSSVGFERSIRCRTKEISNIRQELETTNDRSKRLEEALDCLTLVVGLTPVAGNKDALQEAVDLARAALKAKEAKP
jgi:hypothetical protein